MTHDSKRHGTATLFAALNVLEGTVIGSCYPRHRNGESRAFLRQVDRANPAGLDLHLSIDNYGTHTHAKVQQWLAKHTRFHLHFSSTSSSWLNLIERWFRELSTKRIRRSTFPSVPKLIAASATYIGTHNAHPTPFVWTKKAETILT